MAPDSTPLTLTSAACRVFENDANIQYSAIMAAAFGVVAGTGALLFLDGVPRVQRDILAKVPIIGPFFVHDVPPEDNPF